jgi:hypothetical protein
MIPCSKCGDEDIKKYTRMKLRKSGKRTKSVASYCIVCHYEEQRIREERRYSLKLAYNRLWRRNNRALVNASARRSYNRKRWQSE